MILSIAHWIDSQVYVPPNDAVRTQHRQLEPRELAMAGSNATCP